MIAHERKVKDLFCPQPFTNIVVNGLSGKMQPCCVMKNWPKSADEKLWEDLRKEFFTGEGNLKKRFCQSCIEQEKYYKKSPRTSYLSEYKENPEMLTMEYNAPSNYCNLKCHMCGPWNSSTFAKENLSLSDLDPLSQEFTKKYGDKTLIQLDDALPKGRPLTRLKLFGGETLAIRQNYELMQKFIDSDQSQDISLEITTNATLTPKFDGKDIFDFIPNFKDCKMVISVEAWGEKNNYLRFPSNWEVIMKNAERFQKCSEVIFASTVNSLNIGYLMEVSTGATDMGCDYTFGSLVWGPKELYTVEAIPLNIREIYLERFYDEGVDINLVRYLEEMDFDLELSKRMMTDIIARDKYRDTCLLDLFPEWKPYYE